MDWIITKTLWAGYRILNQTWIFDANPEWWHQKAMAIGDFVEQRVWGILNLIKSSSTLRYEEMFQWWEIGGVEIKNRVWLAAWFAKQPHGLKAWESLGFGWISIWGITRDAQDWRDKPRLWREQEDINGQPIEAARNFMWFPGPGRDEVIKMLKQRRAAWLETDIPVFANLASSKSVLDTYLQTKDYEPVIAEFVENIEMFYEYADGFEVNVSCPNQAGVTAQQDKDKIGRLLKAVIEKREEIAKRTWVRKPILVKVAPMTLREWSNLPIKDQTRDGLISIAQACNENNVDGVIATNTSIEHIGRISETDMNGGLSGEPIFEQSLATVKLLRQHLNTSIKIIGVGWINSGEKALQMLDAGAEAVQMYTPFVYDISTPFRVKEVIQARFTSLYRGEQ